MAEEYVTIKIRRETYEKLVRAKLHTHMIWRRGRLPTGQRISYDWIIDQALDLLLEQLRKECGERVEVYE